MATGESTAQGESGVCRAAGVRATRLVASVREPGDPGTGGPDGSFRRRGEGVHNGLRAG